MQKMIINAERAYIWKYSYEYDLKKFNLSFSSQIEKSENCHF